MRTNSNIIKKGMPPYSVNSVNLLTKIGEFGQKGIGIVEITLHDHIRKHLLTGQKSMSVPCQINVRYEAL
jgi:hypothetical protein